MVQASFVDNSDVSLLDIVSFERLKCEFCDEDEHEPQVTSSLRKVAFTDDGGDDWIGVFVAGSGGNLDSEEASIEIFSESPIVLVFLHGTFYWVDVNKREVTHFMHSGCEDFSDVRARLLRHRQWLYYIANGCEFRIHSREGIVYEEDACCLQLTEVTDDVIHLKDCTDCCWEVCLDDVEAWEHGAIPKSAFKIVACRHCDEQYAYLVRSDATEANSDLLFPDLKDSAELLRSSVEQELLRKIHNRDPSLCCPNCGRSQEVIMPRLLFNSTTGFGAATVLLSFVPLLFGNSSNWALTILLALTGLAVLTWGYVLAIRSDQHTRELEWGMSVGRANSVWGKQLAELLESNPDIS